MLDSTQVKGMVEKAIADRRSSVISMLENDGRIDPAKDVWLIARINALCEVLTYWRYDASTHTLFDVATGKAI